PAHTDPKKWQAVLKLAEQFLSKDAIQQAGLLDYEMVQATFAKHEDESVPIDEKVQLDAVINHMLGIQILHHHFVQTDVPALAATRAKELGWHA
ncbi:MAG TPA: asparagine synthetase B, partial [Pseudidiomarina sp.]|nr:asparagine synthetase B [Pseudidiomarina sp.]